jgi:hypothetical protein
MKKQILRKLQLILAILILAIPVSLAFAGSKNQNGENGIQGTDKINNIDGCRPNENAGDVWVYVPSAILDALGFTDPVYHEWKGGPCCTSNTLSGIGEDYPLSNECCNGPDTVPIPGIPGEPAPGNHCLCFAIRGYPYAVLPPL